MEEPALRHEEKPRTYRTSSRRQPKMGGPKPMGFGEGLINLTVKKQLLTKFYRVSDWDRFFGTT
jgi:hypothetical protein